MKFFTQLALLPLALAAPILESRQDAQLIPNKWIVVLRDDADDNILSSTVQAVTDALGGSSPDRVYNMAGFKGFSMTLESALLNTVSNLANIKYIEQDSRVSTNALVSQQDPPYGLARISHRDNGANEYVYDDSAGEGTDIYIIDTGIYAEHNDFGGRATFDANFADDGIDTDCNGHGTHVSGTAGSTTYGVSKKARLHGVKVLSCDGSGAQSGVIAGIEYATNAARGKRATANLSLGGLFNQASNDAVEAAVANGLFMSVAAGNSGLPTFTSSPASAPNVCTIGAIGEDDRKAAFSNFGLLIDVFAPGVDVESTWIDGPDDTNTISGTSMAAPHVAGLASYLLALEGDKNPVDLCQRIKDLSSKGKMGLVGGLLSLSRDRIAFNGAGE
ncbi:hypothetical protein MBLNU230_g5993t1 [Neophaeotheca triangularis]